MRVAASSHLLPQSGTRLTLARGCWCSADGYGYCWNQAPELAIQQGNLKLHMNRDRSRFELYNRSLTFEADDISKEQPAEAERLATILEKWAATLDPIPPNTMSSNSKHMGCLAYGYPTAETASASMAAALGIVAEEGDAIDAMYRI